MNNNEFLIYLTGFIDGEGLISLYKHRNKNYKLGFYIRPVIQISNNNKQVIDRISNYLSYYGIKNYCFSKKQSQVLHYFVRIENHKSLEKLIKLILPYSIVKQKHLKLLSKYINLRKPKSNFNPYTKQEINLCERFRELNRRYPVV